MIDSKQHRGCRIQDPGTHGIRLKGKNPCCTSRGCRVQNSGPSDLWLLVAEKNRLFAQRTVCPCSVLQVSYFPLPPAPCPLPPAVWQCGTDTGGLQYSPGFGISPPPPASQFPVGDNPPAIAFWSRRL